MRIKLYVNTGFPGAKHEDYIEVEDNASDAELEKMAIEYLHERVECGWKKID